MTGLLLGIACAFGIVPRCAAWHRSGKGLFYTRPVPDSVDLIVPEVWAQPEPSTNGWKAYLVAGTPDGGPFSNYWIPSHNVSRSALCDVRNFHEEVEARMCMHWQVEDDYDAPWFHRCFEPDAQWIDSHADAMLATSERLAAEASLLQQQQQQQERQRGRQQGWRDGWWQKQQQQRWQQRQQQQHVFGLTQQNGALEEGGGRESAGHTPGDFIQKVWAGTCEGSYVVLNMLDVQDAKGLEVLYQRPDFSDACMEEISKVVVRFGLDTWPFRRCNIDRSRKPVEFPWATKPRG